MLYLVLSVSFSTLNHLLFKVFAKFKVSLLVAIVANYLVCTAIGFSIGEEKIVEIVAQKWFPFSLLQGSLLVGSFFLIGLTTRNQGVATASLATRLSVALPTIVAFFLYGDSITFLKVSGLLLAFFALYLSCMGGKKSHAGSGSVSSEGYRVLPIILFVSFGVHSILLKFVQENYLAGSAYTSYVMASFVSAFLISFLILVVRIAKKMEKVSLKSVASGVVLGFSNYGAVYFLIRMLGVDGWESSVVFPTVSVSVVLLSSLLAIGFFKEKVSKRLLYSLLAGLVAIVLVNC